MSYVPAPSWKRVFPAIRLDERMYHPAPFDSTLT
jgi:hypothetical protein